MSKYKEYQIGDKVRFGAYGYNDEEKVYEIVGKSSKLSYMFGIEYEIKNPDTGHTFHAYGDELFPVN